MQPLRFYDFFAGVGMAEVGLAPDWACVWANDFDPKKGRIYAANHDPSRFHLGDVADVAVDDLPIPADLAWASFPCQDLSLAGWRRGMSPGGRSGTFWQFWRIMKDLHDRGERPRLIVLENVVGLLSGADFPALCEALAALEMRFGALVINADRFVPQSRPRVFIVALDDRIAASPWEDPAPAASPWFTRGVWQAWERLPPETQARWVWWNVPAPSAPVVSIETLIEAEPIGLAWHAPDETARLLDMMTPINLAKVAAVQTVPGRHVGFLYKRTRKGAQRAEVRFDGVAGCLRTSTGGSSRQTVLVVEDGRVRSRLLSVREAARLMGLADTFGLPVSYNEAYHAMGDGVAVPVVAWLSAHLLTPLAHAAPERIEVDVADRVLAPWGPPLRVGAANTVVGSLQPVGD
jgi:DNA (cytosine-5)-methyltransferase 1